jgi:hypothetical protein
MVGLEASFRREDLQRRMADEDTAFEFRQGPIAYCFW